MLCHNIKTTRNFYDIVKTAIRKDVLLTFGANLFSKRQMFDFEVLNIAAGGRQEDILHLASYALQIIA